jgi:hypothetical protein
MNHRLIKLPYYVAFMHHSEVLIYTAEKRRLKYLKVRNN